MFLHGHTEEPSTVTVLKFGAEPNNPTIVPVVAAVAVGAAAPSSGPTASAGSAAAVTAAIFRRFTRTPSSTRISDWWFDAGWPADRCARTGVRDLLVQAGRRLPT